MIAFPTAVHETAAREAERFFAGREGVNAVLVVGSCARGAADDASDLDMLVLAAAPSVPELESGWSTFRATSAPIASLVEIGPFHALHLDIEDGRYEPTLWDDGGGPDGFELDLGNHLAYSAVLWETGSMLNELKARWLPYYEDSLRGARLAMVRKSCLHEIDAIERFVRRGLPECAFDRLYKAFREFVQGLFIARRTYPICYTKWLRYQMDELLGEPQLYGELLRVLEVGSLDGDAVSENRDRLAALTEGYLAD